MDLSPFSLEGKVAIVTGASRGIGKSIALGFAQAGADVVALARTVSEIENTAAQIRELGRRSLAIPADVREIEQVAGVLQKTAESFGRVDILVNNAGHGEFPADRAGKPSVPQSMKILDLDLSMIDKQIEMYLRSVFICSKIVGEAMAKQRTGNIINISSVAGLGPSPGAATYGAAKAGVIALTKSLAVEWAPYNIRVNAIAPGLILTPILIDHLERHPTRREAQLRNIALGRGGKPEEIATVAIFLSSDAASYITGQTIEASGGLLTAAY